MTGGDDQICAGGERNPSSVIPARGAERRGPESLREESVEAGSGTVLAVVVVAVILVASLALGAISMAYLARSQAQTAADFGALAGALAVRTGHEPCDAAGEAVARNSGALVFCDVLAGGRVQVVASRATPMPGIQAAQARATAGPRPP